MRGTLVITPVKMLLLYCHGLTLVLPFINAPVIAIKYLPSLICHTAVETINNAYPLNYISGNSQQCRLKMKERTLCY